MNWQVIKISFRVVLAEQWLKFPEFEVTGPTVLARLLVMVKGHRVEEVPELPSGVGNKVESYKKTKEAPDDIIKVHVSLLAEEKLRSCPVQVTLIIYNESSEIIKAFRSILGVTLLIVSKLDTLKLTAGGHVGCLAFGQNAFQKLDELLAFGTKLLSSSVIITFSCTRCQTQILKSPEIQGALGSPEEESTENLGITLKLDLYAKPTTGRHSSPGQKSQTLVKKVEVAAAAAEEPDQSRRQQRKGLQAGS
ncbi:hypothetical protein A6R68_18074 [Neotoma lepida]|uniref:Uncharacterized protein n=1 Tax=Neotoma lepida TaxID=56216 RepID=A0A1A6HMI5_NEOLE|nr:hypothetical protein A6R68_18074 [Neotoma lepida]